MLQSNESMLHLLAILCTPLSTTSANTLLALVVVTHVTCTGGVFTCCAGAYTGYTYCSLHCVVVMAVVVTAAMVVALAILSLRHRCRN